MTVIEQEQLNELEWLNWLLNVAQSQEELKDEAWEFVNRVNGGRRNVQDWVLREYPMAVWLMRNALLCTSLDEALQAVQEYLPRQPQPEAPPRPQFRPQGLPAGHTPPQGMPVNADEEMLRRLWALQQQGLLGQPQPAAPAQDVLVGPQGQFGRVVQDGPVRRPSALRGCLYLIAYLVTTVLAVLAIYAIAMQVGRAVFHRDIATEVKLFIAGRTQDVKLNKDGYYLDWQDGNIIFYSHAWDCSPGFRTHNAEGALLPPPSEWPDQDAPQLLKSEYMGCIPNSQFQQWGGYWGDSPWGELGMQDQRFLDDYWTAWNKVEGGVKVEKKDDKWPELGVWVEYANYGLTRDKWDALGSPDLSKNGATGQTGEQAPPPTPTDVPQPTPTRYVPPPTQPPQEQAPPPAQEQQQAPPPADQGQAAPADQGQAAPPPAQPTQAAPPPTTAPAPTSPPPTQVFATQTPVPAVQPTMTDAQVQQALIDAKARLDAAATAQALPPTPFPTAVGHLQAPNATPVDHVNPNPSGCLSCHH